MSVVAGYVHENHELAPMPRTIAEGFRDFLPRLTPSAGESAAASGHRASIEARLKTDFEISRFFRIGSFGNGTSISGYSDVDYLASIPNRHLTGNSTYSLGKVRDSLAARFPNTGVRVSAPAVKAPFGTGGKEATDVVPGEYMGTTPGGGFLYDIPDCYGGWLRACPDAHNDYVHAVNEKHGGKVKPLIRFIKAWKFFRQVPVSSFYLEMRTAKYADGETVIVYEIDVRNILRSLWVSDFAKLQDPTGIAGYINPCSSEPKRQDAISKAWTAYSRANKAVEDAAAGNISEAFGWWQLLYDHSFPDYYY